MEVLKHFKLFSQKIKKNIKYNNELILLISGTHSHFIRNFINKLREKMLRKNIKKCFKKCKKNRYKDN